MAYRTMVAGQAELNLEGTGFVITRIEPLGLTSSFCAKADPSQHYSSGTTFDIDASGTYQGSNAGCIDTNNAYGFDPKRKEWFVRFFIHSTNGSPVRLTIEPKNA